MPATTTACRCGKPLIRNGTGAAFCEHCDRICEVSRNGGNCIDCNLFDKATKEHALKTSP